MKDKNSIYRWTGIIFTSILMLVCCSFLMYNSQPHIPEADLQECVAKKKKRNKMVWEDLSRRFFTPAEKNSEKTPG